MLFLCPSTAFSLPFLALLLPFLCPSTAFSPPSLDLSPPSRRLPLTSHRLLTAFRYISAALIPLMFRTGCHPWIHLYTKLDLIIGAQVSPCLQTLTVLNTNGPNHLGLWLIDHAGADRPRRIRRAGWRVLLPPCARPDPLATQSNPAPATLRFLPTHGRSWVFSQSSTTQSSSATTAIRPSRWIGSAVRQCFCHTFPLPS